MKIKLMPIITLSFFLIGLTLSCSKEKKFCWECTYGAAAGCPQRPNDIVCSDQEDYITNGWVRPKDCNGGELSYHCSPR